MRGESEEFSLVGALKSTDSVWVEVGWCRTLRSSVIEELDLCFAEGSSRDDVSSVDSMTTCWTFSQGYVESKVTWPWQPAPAEVTILSISLLSLSTVPHLYLLESDHYGSPAERSDYLSPTSWEWSPWPKGQGLPKKTSLSLSLFLSLDECRKY